MIRPQSWKTRPMDPWSLTPLAIILRALMPWSGPHSGYTTKDKEVTARSNKRIGRGGWTYLFYLRVDLPRAAQQSLIVPRAVPGRREPEAACDFMQHGRYTDTVPYCIRSCWTRRL
ncbi:hypothetical protein DFH06DRAFT_1479648 [Mycena polygramma]|nr:hypothetical protein DFH06DRAFT_1479648 [Mycena polygramma]